MTNNWLQRCHKLLVSSERYPLAFTSHRRPKGEACEGIFNSTIQTQPVLRQLPTQATAVLLLLLVPLVLVAFSVLGMLESQVKPEYTVTLMPKCTKPRHFPRFQKLSEAEARRKHSMLVEARSLALYEVIRIYTAKYIVAGGNAP